MPAVLRGEKWHKNGDPITSGTDDARFFEEIQTRLLGVGDTGARACTRLSRRSPGLRSAQSNEMAEHAGTRHRVEMGITPERGFFHGTVQVIPDPDSA